MVRLASKDDLSRVAEIQVFGWRNAYRGIVSDEVLFKTLSVCKRKEKYEKELTENETEIFVNEINGIITGFIVTSKCRDNDKRDSFELCAIYVEP